MPVPILPIIGPDITQWGRQINNYLQRNLGKLYFKTPEDNPSEDGVVMHLGSWQLNKLCPAPILGPLGM
jgi:hypothetical protein